MVRIFLVDDDKDIIDIIGYIIKKTNHNLVAHARDGEEAIEVFQEKRDEIDLILMDHRMTVINGLDATKRILKMSPSTKILFISADDSIRKEVMELGSIEFLLKPFGHEELMEAIERYS